MERAFVNSYDFFGSINTVFIFISLFGIFSQVKTIWIRKEQIEFQSRPTELLSLNQFTVSYLAYLSFFIYGYSIEPFNDYIVWPRLIATLLVGIILFEIWLDRRNTASCYMVIFALLSLILALAGLFFGESVLDQGRKISTAIILVISILIAQGYYHQIRLIIKSGKTGAIDLKMSQFILLMDISTMAFALSMGIANGWPLMVLAVTSAVTKIVIIYLFYWVKNSKVAYQRRE